MGSCKACSFVLLMTLAVFVFWCCGLVLSIYEIIIGAFGIDRNRNNSTAMTTDGFGRCSWKQSNDQVDLLPLYLLVSGLIWLLWTFCSALVKCSSTEKSAGFYIGSGDMKVHCVALQSTTTRNGFRKFGADLLMVSAVTWTAVGSVFTFDLGYMAGGQAGAQFMVGCAPSMYQSARITIAIRWAWIAYLMLLSLMLKIMKHAVNRNAKKSPPANGHTKSDAV